MEHILAESSQQPVAGELRKTQIAQRGTWANMPGRNLAHASAHIIHVTPANGTTVTEVNPLDPGTTSELTPSWRLRPSVPTTVVPAERVL